MVPIFIRLRACMPVTLQKIIFVCGATIYYLSHGTLFFPPEALQIFVCHAMIFVVMPRMMINVTIIFWLGKAIFL